MGGGRKGGKLTKDPSKKVKTFGLKLRVSTKSATASSSARDTNTDATSGEDNRRRKKPNTTRNRFVIDGVPLSDYTDLDGDNDDNNDNDEHMENMSDASTKNKTKQKVKSSPIVCVGSDVGSVRSLVERVAPSRQYVIRSLSVGIRIDMFDEIEHTVLLGALRQNNLQFYMYHNSKTRNLKFCVHGLLQSDKDDLVEALKKRAIIPDDIKALNIKRKHYQDQAVFLLYFKSGATNLTELRKTKHVNNIAVKFERYHPQTSSSPAHEGTASALGIVQ